MSRDYAIFWVGQFLSVIGTWMQNTTLPYVAYRITGSSLDLGLIGFATTLPMLFVPLPAGVNGRQLRRHNEPGGHRDADRLYLPGRTGAGLSIEVI